MEEILNHVNEQSVVDPKKMVNLEAIDMTWPESKIIPKLMHNLHNVGFLALKNVPDFDEAEHFKAVKAFFKDIPTKEQRKLVWHNHNKSNDNYYRGFTPFVDNDPAHKEMYDIGGDVALCSDEALKLALYEDAPFPS